MSLLKRLRKIDQRTKSAVHGWVREHETQLKLSKIPTCIISICILFFRKDEIFDIFDKTKCKLSLDKKTISKLGRLSHLVME